MSTHRPVSVAYLSLSSFPSGRANSIQTVRVCEGLIEAGCKVELWAAGSRAELTNLEEVWRFYGISSPPDVILTPANVTKASLICIVAALRLRVTRCPDFAYCRAPLAALALRLAGLQTVLEIHSPTATSSRAWKMLCIWPLRRRLQIIVISHALKTALHAEPATSALRVACEPDAVQNSSLSPASDGLSPHPQSRDGRLTVGYAGTIAPGRGIELILQVAAEAPTVDFVLAGHIDESIQDWFESETQRMRNVTYVGELEPHAVPAFLARSHCLIAPYIPGSRTAYNEDTTGWMSPLKVFEYMAAGRPILVADLPVIREILDETSAVLLPPDDPKSWLSAVHTLDSDPGAFSDLAIEARMRVEKYTWLARGRRIAARVLQPEPLDN